MDQQTKTRANPEIMAPAGDETCFLAALAAGADAVYAGLKHFSARMEADNFSTPELARLTALARDMGRKVYVPMNVMLRPGDLDAAGRLLDRLSRTVKPHGIICQDLGLVALAGQVGYPGEVHLSTLANVSFPAALGLVRKNPGACRVVLPRELSIDEIKAAAAVCPPGLSLEVFVHGALCYGVSGRCYWSSYMGGKSGLRGRCVQPCRRVYDYKGNKARYFSCLDLSLDVMAKLLLEIPQIAAWKIEGRKKGPHYVFYTTRAYKMLRDNPEDPGVRKAVGEILDQALGRNTTRYNYLPQRAFSPVDISKSTGSGRVIGKLAGKTGAGFFKPRQALLPGDLLRVGFEDEPWHRTVPVRKPVPKNGRLDLRFSGGSQPRPGSPVFLVDRREPELVRLVAGLKEKLAAVEPVQPEASEFAPRMPKPVSSRDKARDMHLNRRPPRGGLRGEAALWLTPACAENLAKGAVTRTWWWLPPVIWPDEQDKWTRCLSSLVGRGARKLVLNQAWQVALLPPTRARLTLWAGPFCNTGNALALDRLAKLGFTGAVVSPEFSGPDFLALPGQSPLPLGLVIAGAWPVCVSRTLAAELKPGEPFTSPKGETFWTRNYGPNTWVYPAWPVDLTDKRRDLDRAGYKYFIHIYEPCPRTLPKIKREGHFNWDVGLL